MTAKAAKPPSKELTVTDNRNALIEAFSGEDYGDSIQVEFSTFPTVKLIQKTSAEADEGLAQPGEYFHNILRQSMEQPMTVIPLMVRQTYVIWKPINDGGGIIARSTDGKMWDKPNFGFQLKIDGQMRNFNTKGNVKSSGLAEWGSSIPGDNNSKPVADMSIVIFCVLKDHPEFGPFRILLRSSALKDTNRFIQLLGKERTVVKDGVVKHLPPFAFQFDIGSVKKTEGTKSWYIPTFSNLGALDITGKDAEFVVAMRDVYMLHKAQFDNMAVMDSDNEPVATVTEGTEF